MYAENEVKITIRSSGRGYVIIPFIFTLLKISDDIDLRNVNPEMGARTLMRHLPEDAKEKIQMEVVALLIHVMTSA